MMHPMLRRAIPAVGLCVVLPGACRCVTPAPEESQPVTVRIVGETLATAVPRIGKAAEVRLGVDRSLADHRILLFVDTQPLAVVRRQLREFVPTPPGSAAWLQEGSVLQLREDLASRSARAKQASERQRATREYRTRGYQLMLGWCQPHAQDPPHVAKQRARDAELVQVFAGLPPAARQTAFNGSRVAVPFPALTPAAQALVRNAVAGRRSGVEDHPAFVFDGDKDAAKVVVVVTPIGTVENPGLRLWLDCRPSQNGRFFPDIVNPPRWDPAEGWSWEHVRKAGQGRPRGPKGAPSNPALASRISLEGGEGAVIEKVLSDFQHEAKLPVLGEYDPCYVPPMGEGVRPRKTLPSAAVTRVPVREALEIIARTFDLTWDYHEGWIWLRSSRTPLARAGQLDLSPPPPATDPGSLQ